MNESYRTSSSKRPYFHWLERAQLGQMDYAVIRWPKTSQNLLFQNVSFSQVVLEKYIEFIPQARSYEYHQNINRSQLFELAEGHKYVPNQSFIRELSQTVSLVLKNETKVSLVEMTQIEMEPSLPKELNPLFLEKKFDFRLAKENTKIQCLTQLLGGSVLSSNEMLFTFVLHELIENIIIFKDKFPQFKLYLSLPVDKFPNIDVKNGFEPVIEILDWNIQGNIQQAYKIKPLAEESLPYLGQFTLSSHIDLSESEKKNKIQLENSWYTYSDRKLTLAGKLKNKYQIENTHIDSHSEIQSLATLLGDQLHMETTEVENIEYGLSYENGTGLEHFNSSLSFWTQFVFNHKTYRVHNTSALFKSLVQFSTKGIESFSGLGRKDLATHRKGSKREHDLKVLKHQGIATLIIYEVCLNTVHEPLSTGQIAANEEELIAVIENNIFNIFKKSIFVEKYGEGVFKGNSLQDYISETVYEFLLNCIKQVIALLKDESRYIVADNNVFKLTQQQQFTAQALLAMLEPIVQLTRGDLFSKGNSKFLEKMAMLFQGEEIYEPVFKETSIDIELRNQYIQKNYVSDSVITFLFSKMTDLSSRNWQIYIDSIPLEKLAESDFKSEIILQNGKTDWFELSPVIFFKGMQIRLEDIRFSGGGSGSRINNGIVFYQGRPYIIDVKSLPKYAMLEKFWERIKKEAHLKGNTREKEFVQIPRSQILELLALAESGTKIVTDNVYWNQIYNFYKNLGSEKQSIEIPQHLQEILKDYQKTGSQWISDLYQLQLGGILADDMGLGKTLQALTFLDIHRSQNNNTWSLIVVPTSLCFNWINESKKFTPELKMEIFSPSKKKEYESADQKNHKVVIATYGLLLEHEEFFSQIGWDVVIFDEAQNLKNLSSKRTSSARLLKAKFKLALSGTPLENNYLDFFSLADLVLPGSLGTYKSFNEIYGIGKPVDKDDIQILKNKMKPIVLRRTKQSVHLNLPQKHEESCYLDFSAEQLDLYKKLALTHNDQVTQMIKENGAAGSQIAMLTALLRLRQVCSDPNGIPNIKFLGTPPKISYIRDCIHEHIENGKSILVFTQFLVTLENLSKMFAQSGIAHAVIHGAISSKGRSQVLEQFQNSDKPMVLLMTLKTGGVGLNLTKASVVYHVEPWWNPAVENQATDRVHRLGQKNDIQVYRLIMKDSVEEKIELLKLKKKSYFDSLFSQEESTSVRMNNDGHSINYLSVDDFKFLLS